MKATDEAGSAADTMFKFGGKKGLKPAKPAWAKSETSHSSRWLTPRAVDDLRKNVKALPEIPKGAGEAFFTLAEEAVGKRDMHALSNALMQFDGMTVQRAGAICRSLGGKAKAITDADNQIRLGLKATWIYGSAAAGCGPDMDNDHRAASGKVYDPAKGLEINGARRWPGYEDGCTCLSRSIVPGFG